MKNKVFLGGTCANTTWRNELIRDLHVSYFDPVVENWTSQCIEIEDTEKGSFCNIHLYVITSAMQGVYSIAEVVESVMTPDKVTILHVGPAGFTEGQLRSLRAVVDLVKRHGGIAYVDDDLKRTANVINNAFRED
ncbi:MAG: hypothetical protein COA71_14495 [SAR86 cluster bacterium]|uniref:Uncharacterized protein n=1 Tax=SAR86 cluster bacterium TaxID=2030880 RepID=A0A2A5C5R8_9GAMM|nr:MAG: hypothetical protein COA71_14495 [SAR86 cluster bacterium]